MPSWVRFGLLFGAGGFIAAGIVLYVILGGPECDYLAAVLPWIGVQVGAAWFGGLAEAIIVRSAQPGWTGFATCAVSSLTAWWLLALLFAHGLPEPCQGFGALVIVAGVFFSPVVVGFGGIAGWVAGSVVRGLRLQAGERG